MRVDYDGNIIDGEHRFGVDMKWRKVRLEDIRTEKERIIARTVSNTIRRSMPSKEKTELLERLGQIYLNEGIDLERSLINCGGNRNELHLGDEILAGQVQTCSRH